MRIRTLSLLAVASLALAFAPATTADETHDEPGYHLDPEDPDSPYFIESRAFYTATGPTGVGNLDSEQGVSISWSDAEPTSPTGGVTVANGASGLRAIADADEFEKGQLVAEGTVTGLLDSITLDLHLVEAPVAPFCTVAVAVDLDIDDITVLDMDNHGNNVDVPYDGGVARLKITDIHQKLASFSTGSFDFVGDETTEHTVRVAVTQYPICTEVVWRYDSAEFPTSIRFNHDPSLADVSDYATFSVTNPPPAPPPADFP